MKSRKMNGAGKVITKCLYAVHFALELKIAGDKHAFLQDKLWLLKYSSVGKRVL